MPTWQQPAVPNFVQKLLESKGRPVQIDWVLHGGYTLEKHWSNGEFQTKMSRQNYDYVIIQPYSVEALVLPECFRNYGPNGGDGPKGRATFIEYADKMIQMARQNGATPLIFEPWIYEEGHAWLQADFACYKWPNSEETWFGGSRVELQRRLHQGFNELKRAIAAKYNYDLRIIHVGDLWPKMRSQPSPELNMAMMHTGDYFHPTDFASLLSAYEIIEQVTGIPATNFDYKPGNMSDTQVDYLERISAF